MTAVIATPDNQPVVLIACSAGKITTAAAAKDLYASDLFAKSRAYAESIGSDWAILSAKHGLVMPDAVIAPYDVKLADLNKRSRLAWGALVADALTIFATDTFIMLAGEIYRDPIIKSQIWRARRYQAIVPMQGLGIGLQKAWLKSQLAHASQEAIRANP